MIRKLNNILQAVQRFGHKFLDLLLIDKITVLIQIQFLEVDLFSKCIHMNDFTLQTQQGAIYCQMFFH